MGKIKKEIKDDECKKTKTPVHKDGQNKLEQDENSIESESELECEIVTETHVCKTCKETFTDKLALQMHMKKAHMNKNPYKCLLCKKVFKSRDNWTFHIIQHRATELEIPDKHYECEICHKKYQFDYLLNQHMKSHSGEKPYECQKCNKKFALIQNWKVHRRTHEKEKMKFPCQFCNKEFKLEEVFKRHMRIHTREKLFKCSHCQKEFTWRGAFKAHMETHPKRYLQFSCKFCDNKFTTNGGIKLHMKIHERENLFKCSKYDKGFTQEILEQNLKTKEKLEFPCTVCHRKLASKGGLKEHMNIHTRRNMFKCSKCDKEFLKVANLKRHLNTFHGKRKSQKTSLRSSGKVGGSDVNRKSMNECTTALSKIIKSEKIDSETDLTEYIITAIPEPNIEEIEASYLAYNTCYSETICKEEVMLPGEND